MTGLGDPTYVQEEINANPEWKLAWVLSEIDNDNAPIGWYKYLFMAQCIRNAYTMEERK